MIIDNATIKSKTEYKPRVDESTGYPMDGYTGNRKEVLCQVRPVSQDLLARAGSGLPVESIVYEVLIDAADWERFEAASSVSVTFYNNQYFTADVISTEYLQAVNQYKLICRCK